MVFDCGGGTTDISIIGMNYIDAIFEVKNVYGENFFGGEDITNNLVNWTIDKIKIKHPQHIFTPKHFNIIKRQCDLVKKELSYSNNSLIQLENIIPDEFITFNISIYKFLEINNKFFQRIKNDLNEIKEEINYNIDNIVFVGGSTRIPYFKKIFNEIFPNVPICNTIDPDHTISIGASYQGYLLKNDEFDETLFSETILLDIIPIAIGIETIGCIMTPIISKNSILPISKNEIFTNSEDYIDTIDISVYQGNRKFIKDNNLITKFYMKNLNNALKKGQMQIKISFDINSDGILNIYAVDLKNDSNKIHIVLDNNQIKNDEIEEFTSLDLIMNDLEESRKILIKLEILDIYNDFNTNFENNKENSDNFQIINEIQQLLENTKNDIINYKNLSIDYLKNLLKTLPEQWNDILMNNKAGEI